MAEVTETPEPPKRARRTSTRTRRKPAETEAPAAEAEAPAAEAPPAPEPEEPAEMPAAEPEPVDAPAAEDESPEATAESSDDADAAEDRPRRSRSRRGRRGGAGRSEEGRGTGDDDARASSEETDAPSAAVQSAAPELRPILRAIEQQARQVDRLARVTEDLAGRVDRPRSGGAAGVAAPAARVGVFVDTANIELATDRLRVRFDWGKIMKLLLHDRQLVRAVAYSPIHDDPAVSIETQRFVEPFLDKGFKIVTKPFRRFQDGSIKANLDIELALDVVAMLDRLDVVVLVSGDGDFQRLVEMAQGKGVRVEVASVGMSTASNLRHAADEFIDLGSRVRDIRV
ncbi:MAG: NYN domain-containing protein [Dehalococcoidia bacterium]